MEIIVEQSARNYILKKSPQKAVTLGVGKRDGANCGCSVSGGVYPSVRLGVNPYDVESYNKVDKDGVVIYYPESVSNVFRTVTVKVEGALFLKQLLALGS
jgi:hypothetical protein